MQVSAAHTLSLRISTLCLTGLAILASLAAAATVTAARTDASPVALVFPPWWSATRVVESAASAGDILDVGGVPFIVIVHLDPADAARRARAAGALFILGADPRSLCSFGSSGPKL
jgi:hypothetical protein